MTYLFTNSLKIYFLWLFSSLKENINRIIKEIKLKAGV